MKRSGWWLDVDTVVQLSVTVMVVAFAFAVFFLHGCAMFTPAPPRVSTETCRGNADADFLASVAVQCPKGSFETCPKHDALIAAHDSAIEACK